MPTGGAASAVCDCSLFLASDRPVREESANAVLFNSVGLPPFPLVKVGGRR